ncbi:MAG: alpha/beta hydrolase-fold protein [Gemmatimonadota bacterium]|nr:alpha/beta hydrolase-fold protein [Gemmatimonadota bacterium]
MGRTPALVCPALLLLLAGPVAAQRVETGFLDRTVTMAGQRHRYQVYVPAEYSAATTWPVILFLHGAGERGTDGLLQTSVGLAPAIRSAPDRYPAIVVMPQVPPDSLWSGTPAEVALIALRQTMDEFTVDPDRVYLTGLSMGGHGTWYLAYRNPDLFAAVVPICGWIPDVPRFRGSVPVVPADSGPPLPALARRLARTPIWIFHGEMDPVVPVSGSREPAAALKAVSGDVRYTEFLGLGHNSWDATYGSDAFTRWLFAQRRR